MTKKSCIRNGCTPPTKHRTPERRRGDASWDLERRERQAACSRIPRSRRTRAGCPTHGCARTPSEPAMIGGILVRTHHGVGAVSRNQFRSSYRPDNSAASTQLRFSKLSVEGPRPDRRINLKASGGGSRRVSRSCWSTVAAAILAAVEGRHLAARTIARNPKVASRLPASPAGQDATALRQPGWPPPGEPVFAIAPSQPKGGARGALYFPGGPNGGRGLALRRVPPNQKKGGPPRATPRFWAEAGFPPRGVSCPQAFNRRLALPSQCRGWRRWFVVPHSISLS